MKPKTNTTNTNDRIATELSISAILMLALATATIGCAEANEAEGIDNVITKTGALNESDGEKTSYRKHRNSGKHDRMHHNKRSHRSGKHAGLSRKLFKTALRQDSLTAEQREKIKSLVSQRKQERKNNREEAQKTYRSSLAQGVRDGRIDTNIMTSHLEHVTKQQEERRAVRFEMLNALYGTLDIAQRQAIVDELKAKSDKKRDKFKGKQRHGDENAKGTSNGKWGKRHDRKSEFGNNSKSGCSEDVKNIRGKHGHHGEQRNGLFKLVRELGLTEEQQTQMAQIKQSIVGNRPDKKQHKAKKAEMKLCRTNFLVSFASDSFDAAAARCQKNDRKDRTDRMSQRVTSLSSLTGILTQEQRNQLADRLENSFKYNRKERAL